MIALSADCLLFELASGESLPMSADMISVELMGESGGPFDQEFVSHAANAVFYYFKHELGRRSVSLGEFAEALVGKLFARAPASPFCFAQSAR